MKLRCIDGIVRTFRLSGYDTVSGWYDAICKECGFNFGVHDTKILKPKFKTHSCRLTRKDKNG